MLTLNDGRSELWQWDMGRKLNVDSECSQVHFSNKVFGRSIDVDVVDGVATIPDILLQTDKELTAWAFVGTAENGYTKISKVFKVNKRNKPADYVFTPPDQTSLEEIKEKLDYLESIQDPDAIKDAVEDYLEQNPVEAPVKSVNGKTGAVELKASDVGAISQEDLQNATNEALTQAKESGAFDGQPGDDYVLTDADRQEIAEIAAGLVEVPGGGGGKWKIINWVTLEEACSRVDIKTDKDGRPFSLTELCVYVYAWSASEKGGKYILLPNGGWGTQDAYTSSSVDALPKSAGYSYGQKLYLDAAGDDNGSVLSVSQAYRPYQSSNTRNENVIHYSNGYGKDIHSVSFVHDVFDAGSIFVLMTRE